MSLSWAIALAWAVQTGTPERELRPLHCMAVNTWHEAADLTDAWLINHVVMNRHWRSRQDVCRVIMMPAQFSWTLRGRQVRLADRGEVTRFMNMLSVAAVAQAESENGQDPTDGAHHYHARRVQPGWARRLCLHVKGQHHLFYGTERCE